MHMPDGWRSRVSYPGLMSTWDMDVQLEYAYIYIYIHMGYEDPSWM